MVKVLIDRHVAETLEAPYNEVSRGILREAMRATGFISGETLCDRNDPNHFVIWSTWRSEADWQMWVKSSERRAMLEKLRPLLDRDEQFTVLANCHRT